jgi:predicted NUDIX family NTP pyrophosphohydrolase
VRLSAGLLLFRRRGRHLEVLIAHPGGPFFRHRDDGSWSIPKGEPKRSEDLLAAAQREFHEETGFAPPGPFVPLTPVVQKGGKRVHAWATESDCDRALWCSLEDARRKLKPAQAAWLDELQALVGTDVTSPDGQLGP